MTDHRDQEQPVAPERPRRIDAVGFVAGVVLLGLAMAFALADLDQIEDQVRFVWPTALLGIGLGMLLGTRNRRPDHDGDRGRTDPT